jgi:hypothetical protein
MHSYIIEKCEYKNRLITIHCCLYFALFLEAAHFIMTSFCIVFNKVHTQYCTSIGLSFNITNNRLLEKYKSIDVWESNQFINILHWKPLIVITVGPKETDDIIRIKNINATM